MPRSFTLEEANALIPSLTELVTELHRDFELLRDRQQAFEALEQRIKLVGGMASPRIGDLREEIERLVQRLNDRVRSINALGCELKDIDMGLIDFPSIRDGREVYLCWKLGEPEIRYWHEISAGYAGRTPI